MLIRRRYVLSPLMVLFVLCLFAATGWAAGDKVVPQVADGPNLADGTHFRTRFDITNLGPYESTRITRTVKLMFFRQNGDPWPIALRGRGVATEVLLDLSAYQTVRIETDGASPQLTSGYAIVRNMETQTSLFAEDYEVGVTVYYEVSKQGGVIDTVSVPIGQPTFVFMLPVQNAELQNLFSGLAMVNLANFSNEITLELYPETPRRDSEGKAIPDQTVQLILGPNEQITRFLVDSSLFPNHRTYKGVLRGWALGPVALLALLQTPFSGGVQYATLV
ncbi:MAG: hypothetical protein ABIG68_10290, partial [Acidobacteriota bacterium]